MLSKIKLYAGVVGAWLLTAFGFLAYIFLEKQENKDLQEKNAQLQADAAIQKTLIQEQAAEKDAEIERLKNAMTDDTLLSQYKRDGGGTPPPAP